MSGEEGPCFIVDIEEILETRLHHGLQREGEVRQDSQDEDGEDDGDNSILSGGLSGREVFHH